MNLHFETAIIVSIFWIAITCAVFIVTSEHYLNKYVEAVNALDDYRATMKTTIDTVISAEQQDLEDYSNKIKTKHSALKEVFKNEGN